MDDTREVPLAKEEGVDVEERWGGVEGGWRSVVDCGSLATRVHCLGDKLGDLVDISEDVE